MLGKPSNPYESYRAIALDARIEGSDGLALTKLCLEEAIDELRHACRCEGPDRGAGRATSLERAGNAIIALQAGVAPTNPIRDHLHEFYGGIFSSITYLRSSWSALVARQIIADLTDISEFAG